MIILDTCVLIFDALQPEKLTKTAHQNIENYQKKNALFCADISLWEIGMLIQKKRLEVEIETQAFLDLILEARGIEVLPVTTEIAALATSPALLNHGDPADRIIAATTLSYKARLITCDKKLSEIPDLSIIW